MAERARGRVAEAFARQHPEEVARLMERAVPGEVAALLRTWHPEASGLVASQMIAQAAALCITALPVHDAAAIIEAMQPTRAASLLGKMKEAASVQVVGALRSEASAPILRLLAQPAGTAGSVMDPLVPTVPAHLPASEAVELIRATFPEARSFVYAISPDGVLEGVSTVAELAFAEAAPVKTVMKRKIESIPALASLATIAGHPGWRKVHQLPVVAPDGRLLGVVRHDVVRRIEAELGKSMSRAPAASTAQALGGFYALGLAGLVAWLGRIVLASDEQDAS